MEDQSSRMQNKVTPKLLIVCDDEDVASIWTFTLQQKGWIVPLEKNIDSVYDRWQEEIPELIVIDILLSHTKRIDLCRTLRAASVIPILVLFPTYDERQIIETYQAGVDECIVKPVSPVIFAAKVAAWVRRAWTVPVNGLDRLQAGKLTLDSGQRALVSSDGKITRLTNMEFRLMHLLMSHPAQVLETRYIVRSIWGCYGDGDSMLLKNVVYRLRRKIEDDPSQPRFIQTWPGGYSYQVSSP